MHKSPECRTYRSEDGVSVPKFTLIGSHAMQSKQPRNENKMRKFAEDWARFRQEALEGIAAIEEKDLVGMFGMLAGELVRRRRESELDIIRCEHFHTDDPDNIGRHQEQLSAYNRRLQACSAIVRLLNIFDGGPALQDALDAWADSITTAADFKK